MGLRLSGSSWTLGRSIGVVAAMLLLLGWTASAASADSDIGLDHAMVSTPGKGFILNGTLVTNTGPDPATGVNIQGTVPSTDNQGNPVIWEIFTNKTTFAQPPTSPLGTGFYFYVSLTGPPYGTDPCFFTSTTDFTCQIGPLAAGESRTIVFNPTWDAPLTTALPHDQWTGFAIDAELVGGTDPDTSNNGEFFGIGNIFYYGQNMAGNALNDVQITELSPPASGVYEPGSTISMQITSTVENPTTSSVTLVVPDRDSVTCTGDGVCLTGGPKAMTGPQNRVTIASTGAMSDGAFWFTGDPGPFVFTTQLSAKLPAAPANCAAGTTFPFTFNATQQPTAGGSAAIYQGTLQKPHTVQIRCPEATPSDAGPKAGPNPKNNETNVRRPVASRAQLSVRKTANRRHVTAGGKVRYRITVRNTAKSVAREVRVCDRAPAGLVLLKTPGAKLRQGAACWTFKRLAPSKSLTLKVTARVTGTGHSRTLKNRVVAQAANAKSRSATASVRVLPAPVKPGGVTG